MQRAILVAALTLPALAMAATDLQPGKYRIAAKVNGEADSKPEDKCITQKDIDSGLTRIGVESENEECKVSDFKRGAGTISYRAVCQGGAYSMAANGKLGGDSFDITMKMDMGKGQPQNTIALTGKRIGACSK